MHYLHLSELLRICHGTNESFGPWRVTDKAQWENEDHDDEQQHKQMMQQMSFCLIFNGTQQQQKQQQRQQKQQQQRELLPANVTCRVI